MFCGWVLWLTLVFFPILSVSARAGLSEESAIVEATEAQLLEPPPIDSRLLDQGGPRMIVTNWGYVGNRGGQLQDPTTGGPAIPLEYPAGSRITYLYDAGLWVGGIVDRDTVVSSGSLSYGARHEFYPDTGAVALLRFDDFLSDEGYMAAYTDTFIDPNITTPDRIDGIHRPLFIAVRQECRAWIDTNYRNLIWVQITVTNIGHKTIADAFVGWQVDPDVHHLDNHGGYADDLVGYRRGNASFMGDSYPYEGVYTIDNDGDPDSLAEFTEQSPLGALGLAFLSGCPDPAVRSFNWWVRHYSLGLNWGPYHPSPDPHLPDLCGQPAGDVARYLMMSNGEIDYDQVFAGVDMTAEGWAPPPDDSFFAAGFDIRFLYSVGPYTIDPGDSIMLNFIWFVGDGVHTDPDHFTNTFSFDQPELFLAGLDFGRWATTIAAAGELEASEFTSAAPGPPQEIHLTSWTTTRATLCWRRKGTFDLASYEIFRSNVPGEYPELPLAVVPASDSAFIDPGLEPGQYWYALRAFDTGERRGPRSTDVQANLRMPMAVKLRGTFPANGMLALSWNPSVYPDVAAYHLERSYQTAPGETTSVLLGQTTNLHFTDPDPEEAIIYEYMVAAESGGGVMGPLSNRVRGMVMAFDGGPLIIDQTLADPSGLTDKDSVRAFWQRVLPEATYKDQDRALPPTLTLPDFSPHPVAIIVSSGNFSETEQIHNLLLDYFVAGGNVLFVGRDLFNTDDLAYGSRFFGPGDFAYDYFGVTRVHYPPTLLSHPTRINAQFVGANSCSAGLPDLPVDSARTDWGVPEQLQPAGPGVGFVGWIEGHPDATRCLYTYESLYPDTSSSQGKTVGLFFDDGLRRAAVLTFPLSMMKEGRAQQALHAIVTELGYAVNRPGDFDGDGRVDAVDMVLMIFYLFCNGDPPVNPRNADVNTDCRISLVDLVILINYLYRGGPPPAAGCVSL